jgi:hypothetical protein
MEYRRVPSGPVCARGGLSPLQCEGALLLRRDGKVKGLWTCDKHYEYPEPATRVDARTLLEMTTKTGLVV